MNKKNKNILIVVLLLGGFAVWYFFIRKVPTKPTPVAPSTPVTTTPAPPPPNVDWISENTGSTLDTRPEMLMLLRALNNWSTIMSTNVNATTGDFININLVQSAPVRLYQSDMDALFSDWNSNKDYVTGYKILKASGIYAAPQDVAMYNSIAPNVKFNTAVTNRLYNLFRVTAVSPAFITKVYNSMMQQGVTMDAKAIYDMFRNATTTEVKREKIIPSAGQTYTFPTNLAQTTN